MQPERGVPMLVALLLTASLALAGQTGSAQPAPCNQTVGFDVGGAATEFCLGEQEGQLADAAVKDAASQSRHRSLAAEHYRRAVDSTTNLELKKRSLNALADLFGPKRLNDLSRAEGALRELIALLPEELDPMFHLARLFEEFDRLESAEDMLLTVRRQVPGSAEPYKMLAQFYARRATAMHNLVEAQKPQAPATPPGERDEQGVYRVGGAIAAPHKVDNPVFPPEALVAGIDGVVVAEIVVNESGNVVDAKVVRSIPFLDDAALKAVRNWRYDPTIVNGQAVPVRLTVTVNFTRR